MPQQVRQQVLPSPTVGRDFYDWLDMVVKTAAIVIAVWTAWQASQTYQRDVEGKLLEQKIAVVNQALTSAGKLAVAPDWPSYGRALDDLGVIKHGPVLAVFGDTETTKALYGYYYFCKDKYDNRSKASQIPWNDIYKEYDKLSKVFHDHVLYPSALRVLAPASGH